MKKKEKFEKDLKIYDIWESPNGNLFIKISDSYSLAIGVKGEHTPNDTDLGKTQYIKSDNVTPTKKVGKIVFD